MEYFRGMDEAIFGVFLAKQLWRSHLHRHTKNGRLEGVKKFRRFSNKRMIEWISQLNQLAGIAKQQNFTKHQKIAIGDS